MPLIKLRRRCGNLLLPGLLVLLFFLPNLSHGQCAGTDAAITICDVVNPANQNVNLFALLGPAATPGGTWTDPAQSGALNLTTGILNVWNVHFSGTIIYTYTVNAPGCPDNTATVAVTIGGYTGISSPNGSACSDDSSVNLFQFFVGDNVPAPQFNGAWTDNNNTGALDGSNLDATESGLGTFSFTYKIPQVGSCPAVESTVFVTVYRAPDPGLGSTIALCETDDLSPYTNVNLFDNISGEDANGLWTESGTSELSGLFDSTINIQNIFNTHGPGQYTFTYTVYPTNPVCIPKSSTVIVSIVKVLDLTGATFVINSDICENEIATATYTGVLHQGIMPIPNGSYDLMYHVASNSTNGNVPVTASFLDGVMTFPIPSLLFQQVGAYTITLIDIKHSVGPNPCDNIIDVSDVLNVFPNPKIDNAVLTINPVCVGSAVVVQLSGVGNLADGNYQVTYNLAGANEAVSQQLNIAVSGGTAGFTIPGALIPAIGATSFIITNVLDLQTGCSKSANKSKNFTINPLPDLSNLQIAVANLCKDNQATVQVSGLGQLTNVSITYDLAGANTATGQTATVTTVTGSGSFAIPASLLSGSGTTTINVTAVANTLTNCSATTNVNDSFEVYPLPDTGNISMVINDVCKGQPVSVALSGLGTGTSATLLYSLSGANTVASQSVTFAVNSGNAVFTIPAGLLLSSGDMVLQTISIAMQPHNCSAPFVLSEPFTINAVPETVNFVVAIPNVCSGQPLTVFLSQLGNFNNLNITYNLSGANTAGTQNQALSVVSGAASFTIPAAVLPNTGITTLTIASVTNPLGNCMVAANIAKNFAVNTLLDVSNFGIAIQNVCVGKPVAAVISGLGNAVSVTIAYDLSGANVATGQTVTLNLSNGSGTFIIPAGLLTAAGETILTVTGIVNGQTSCATPVVNVSDNFSIFLLPDAPPGGNAVFCTQQAPTVADLQPNGAQYKWYDSATSVTPLSLNAPLSSGDYFVSQTNAENCESARSLMTVSLAELAPPTLIPGGELFCGADNPTIQELTANANAAESIVWFDAESGGNQLANNVLLQEGATYYGFQFSNALNCTSADALQVKVSLTDCDDDPTHYDFFVPDGFSPNGDNVNDTFRIPDIEFLFPDFKLEIYNRYGNLLFTGDINKPAWDGKNAESGNSGEIMPNGVYFYIVHFNKNNASPKQGRLYLNR